MEKSVENTVLLTALKKVVKDAEYAVRINGVSAATSALAEIASNAQAAIDSVQNPKSASEPK